MMAILQHNKEYGILTVVDALFLEAYRAEK